MISVFEHQVLSGLFEDPEVRVLWSADTQLAHYRAFETAYTEALGAIGRIDEAKAAAASAHVEATQISMQHLRTRTAQDGLPIPELVRQLRKDAGAHGTAIHTGATSQDVMDTSLALTLRSLSDLFDGRLRALLESLDKCAARFGSNTIMGRTRMQAALPITVAHRIAQWRTPLANHLSRLEDLRPSVEVVQLGGPVGDDQGLEGYADTVREHLAQSLGLKAPSAAWHTDRSQVAEYAHVLSLITGTLGKLGQDICLMAQQGIDEVTLSAVGRSSAMPHKSNPTAAELLVTLAVFNATQLPAMHHALVHEQERSGSAWMLEWMILPQMAAATGRALMSARSLVESIKAMGTPEP